WLDGLAESAAAAERLAEAAIVITERTLSVVEAASVVERRTLLLASDGLSDTLAGVGAGKAAKLLLRIVGPLDLAAAIERGVVNELPVFVMVLIVDHAQGFAVAHAGNADDGAAAGWKAAGAGVRGTEGTAVAVAGGLLLRCST